jgi:DNA-directed RNA polymerase subunit RPC12/RpoP
MKCWECKKEIESAVMVHYLYMNKYLHEAITSSTRYVCKECESKLPYNPCHFIEVYSPRGRAQKGGIQ